jgi:hypothetical protein
MRALVTIAADYTEDLRPAFEEVARETGAGRPVTGLTSSDLIDALESADDCAIVSVELVD